MVSDPKGTHAAPLPSQRPTASACTHACTHVQVRPVATEAATAIAVLLPVIKAPAEYIAEARTLAHTGKKM